MLRNASDAWGGEELVAIILDLQDDKMKNMQKECAKPVASPLKFNTSAGFLRPIRPLKKVVLQDLAVLQDGPADF
jgi:hypothetical protein